MEHIALEPQALIGVNIGFGKTRGAGAPGVYKNAASRTSASTTPASCSLAMARANRIQATIASSTSHIGLEITGDKDLTKSLLGPRRLDRPADKLRQQRSPLPALLFIPANRDHTPVADHGEEWKRNRKGGDFRGVKSAARSARDVDFVYIGKYCLAYLLLSVNIASSPSLPWNRF